MIAHALAVAAALAAGPAPLLDAPNADSVAVAGDQVIVSRTGPHGRLTVDALPVAGGRAATLVRRLVRDDEGALIRLRFHATGGRPSESGLGFFINRVS